MDEPVIAVDLGGTHIRIAAFDRSSRTMLKKHVLPTPRDADGQGLTDALVAGIRQMSNDLHISGAALSICSCGPVDVKRGLLLSPPLFPNLRKYALADALEERLGSRPLLNNDANLAGLGEYAFGSGTLAKCLIYMTISTGIGGAVIVDGRLFAGAFDFGGELGHICVVPQGPLCGCGRLGCLEACASGSALESEAYRAIRQGVPSSLNVTLSQQGCITMRDIAKHARLKDALALHIISIGSHLIGEALASLVNIFNPDRIVLGGGVSNAFDLLAPTILSVIRSAAMSPMRDQVEVHRTTLGDDAGLYGAFLYAEKAYDRAADIS